MEAAECKLSDGTDLTKLLVASDLEQYEEFAVKLATDTTLYKSVQVCISFRGYYDDVDEFSLQEALSSCIRSSPLFDLEKWVKAWESALVTAGNSFARNEKIEDIIVSNN